MKSKVVKGKGFSGAIRYVLGKDKAQILGGTEKDPQAFRTIANQRGIKRPVFHASLSLPKGERLNDAAWNKVAETYLERMGFSTEANQFLVARHQDNDHDHIHIIANRVSLQGRVVSDSKDVYRSIQACQELEQQFGLTVTETGRKKGKPSLSPGEYARVKRTRENPKQAMSGAIKHVLGQGEMTAIEFVQECKKVGVVARPSVSKNGRMSGFSFSFQGADMAPMKASKVGFGWKVLQEQVLYTPDMAPILCGEVPMQEKKPEPKKPALEGKKLQGKGFKSKTQGEKGFRGFSGGAKTQEVYVHGATQENGDLDIANTVVESAPEQTPRVSIPEPEPEPEPQPQQNHEWTEEDMEIQDFDDWGR